MRAAIAAGGSLKVISGTLSMTRLIASVQPLASVVANRNGCVLPFLLHNLLRSWGARVDMKEISF